MILLSIPDNLSCHHYSRPIKFDVVPAEYCQGDLVVPQESCDHLSIINT